MTPCDDFAELERRCPRLGGPVTFDYCRMAGQNRNPCFKVFDCWWERFDVVGYFRHRLPADAFNDLRNARPPEKTASLVDMIRQARKRTDS
jgi:hypothetical protein